MADEKKPGAADKTGSKPAGDKTVGGKTFGSDKAPSGGKSPSKK